jgi:UDP-N-acetyl-D-galactosamine dehydrogenase
LASYGMEAVVVDPWADPDEAQAQYGLQLHQKLPLAGGFAAVIAAVAHRQFSAMTADAWERLVTPGGVLMDLKGVISRELAPVRL